jgi:hypothetical protein
VANLTGHNGSSRNTSHSSKESDTVRVGKRSQERLTAGSVSLAYRVLGEGKIPGEDDSPSKRYEEAAILLRSPQLKAVMSYKPPSEATDRNLWRMMYHCG